MSGAKKLDPISPADSQKTSGSGQQLPPFLDDIHPNAELSNSQRKVLQSLPPLPKVSEPRQDSLPEQPEAAGRPMSPATVLFLMILFDFVVGTGVGVALAVMLLYGVIDLSFLVNR